METLAHGVACADIPLGTPTTVVGASTPTDSKDSGTQSATAPDREASAVVLLRASTLQSAPATRLPNELLVEIWSYLCAQDRANVISVCHHWRSCAITAPCLWTSIEILCSTPFDDDRDCTCTTCSDERSRFDSNISRTHALLRLGQSLPLSMTIRADVDWVCEIFLSDLIKLLQQHISRLKELYIVGDFYSEPIFRRITSFPALRVLSVTGGEETAENPFQKTLFANQLSLPVLEVLDICITLLWCTTLDLSLPNVHTLSLAVYSQAELASALRACPNVSTLSIGPNFPDDIDWDDDLVARLHRMPKLRIIDMTVYFELWFFAHFLDAPGTDIDVVYYMHGPALLLDVLAQFRGDVHVACAEHTLAVRDASRRLFLAQPNAFQPNRWYQPWSQLPAESVVALDIGALQWWALMLQAPVLHRVRTVTLRAASAAEIDRVADKHADLGPILPALEVLCIHGVPGSQITLQSPRVAKLVRRLSGNLPLRVLELKGARISDDADLPENIAVCVRVQ